MQQIGSTEKALEALERAAIAQVSAEGGVGGSVFFVGEGVISVFTLPINDEYSYQYDDDLVILSGEAVLLVACGQAL